MDVFTFEKTVMERYEECCMALKCSESVLSARKIHSAWQYHLGLLLEPAGWQALWRLTRPFCEELRIRYPTVVYGTVEQIDFGECKAQFKVEAVPDAEEDVNLINDTHFVNLEELWPTRRQENDALNVETTAEALDNYRFFFNHIWQPWDADFDDESIDYIDTHFLSRAQLYCDMKNKRMSRNSVARLKLLIEEAREIDLKRNRMEKDYLSDDEDDDEDDCMQGKESDENGKRHGGAKRELLRLNIRLIQIKTEFEILENPKMRLVHEESQQQQWQDKASTGLGRVQNVIVMKAGTVQEQIEYLSAIKGIIGKDENTVVRSSLQDALLNANSASDLIFIPHSVQTINYPLALEDGGCMRALEDPELKAIVAGQREEQHLFVCGDYKFENLTLDCRNVDIGILVRPKATVTLKNCVIIGGRQSSTNQGICVRETGKLIMERCRFEDHSTGITARMGSEIFLRQCRFVNCTTGVDGSDSCSITLENVTFEVNEKEKGSVGLLMETELVQEGKTREVFESFNNLPKIPALNLSGTNKGSVCLVKPFLDDSHIILE